MAVDQELAQKTAQRGGTASSASPDESPLSASLTFDVEPISCRSYRNFSTRLTFKRLGAGEMFLPFVRPTAMSDKVALVTGGADDNGLYYVRELLKCGAKVRAPHLPKAIMIADIDQDEGKRVITDLGKEFGENRTAFIKTDPANTVLLKNAFIWTKKHFRNIDIVVNITKELKCDSWEAKIDRNVKGIVRGTLLGIEYMGRHKNGNGGAVVNVITTSSLDETKECPMLVGAKHYIVSFGRAVSSQYYKQTFVKVITLSTTVDEDAEEEAPRRKRPKEKKGEERIVAKKQRRKKRKPKDGFDFANLILLAKTGTVWTA
ncbi:hypothetical protein NQ318_003915 [Aromia moschata]|uniref:Uncharacterized protein n=1 Tax=Aromia moschata TaxID=1265417 RepID=A0AAV8ZA30_9CUCU|nr:hypothetical protein NQ318_003915 [Aromia moschata]